MDMNEHIEKLKKLSGYKEPIQGLHVKFAREIGEKGPQASRVWVI
jgi:cold shock CspA family protein